MLRAAGQKPKPIYSQQYRSIELALKRTRLVAQFLEAQFLQRSELQPGLEEAKRLAGHLDHWLEEMLWICDTELAPLKGRPKKPRADHSSTR